MPWVNAVRDDEGNVLEEGYWVDEPEESPILSDAEVDKYLDSFREEYKDEIPNMDGLEKEVGAANVKTVTDFLSKYGKKAIDLFKDDKGNLDWTKLLAMAGGAAAAMRPNNAAPTGYQGKIPKLTATSNMLTAPPVGRRPGSGGINYGGGTTYRDEAGNIVSSNEKTLEELRQAAINNPFNRGATYEGQQGLGQTDLVNLLNLLNPPKAPTTPAPTTPTTPTAPAATGTGTRPPATGGSTTSTGIATPSASSASGSTVALRTQLRDEYTKGPKTQDALDKLLLKYPPAVMQAEFPEFGGVANYNNATMEAYYRQEQQARQRNREAMRGSGEGFVITEGDGQPYSSGTPKMSAIPQWELDAARAKLTPKQAELIDWRLAQVNPMTGQRVADDYIRQGSNPYAGNAGAQAQEQLDRAAGRKELLSQSGVSTAGIAAWEDPNWRAQQQAKEDAERARADQQRADWMAIPEAQRTVAGPGGATAPTAGYGNYLDKQMATAPTSTGGIMDWYNANVGRTDDRAQGDLNNFLANSGYTAAQISEALPQWSVSDLEAAGAPVATAPATQAPAAPASPAAPAAAPAAAAPSPAATPAPAPAPAPYAPTPEEIASWGYAAGGLAPKGFVIPADVVSHFGNGSSEAGLKLLVANLGAEPIKGEGDGMSDSIPTTIGGKQEARVANEEAFISPEMVKKIGGGDAEKGAKKLYAMMDRVREERTGTKEQGKQIDPNKFMPGGSVKKYVTGGTTTPTGATGSESSLSNWAGDYVTNMLGQGAALANKPYEAYTGPLTAGASGLQNQAFNMAANLRTPGSIGQAAGTAGGIANLAANMRYTPQTTDFLGGANMSGLGMSPSYGMGMPQQQTAPMGVNPMTRPAFMPTGQDQGGDTTMFAAGPHRVKGPANFQQDTLEQAFGGSQYDPATGIESRDIRPLTPDDPRYSQRVQTMPQISEEFRPPVSPDRFAVDGGMTGGVMQPPSQQAGLPGLMQGMQPQASQQVGNIAQQYMNPYLESALRPQMAEMQRAADIARLSDAARLTQAGAYGGSRQAIMESEGRRNLLDKQSEALGQGYATAYDKAMAQFNADQARRAQEAQFGASFGLQGLQTGLQGAQTQAQAGALQSQSDLANLRGTLEAGGVERGIESEGIAADKAQFEEARLNPYKMVQFQQSLLSGMPLSAQSYSMPSQSNLQQFAGGADTLYKLLDILSGKTAATTK